MKESIPRSEQILRGEQRMHSLAEAEAFLYDVLPASPKALFRAGEGFSRSRYFMRELGNPQDQFKAIHVAGTSGKGSTTYYISGLLKAHGFKTGTHVSPHVYDLRERSMIDLCIPSESEFVENLNEIVPTIHKMSSLEVGRPTYFETTMGNAFTLFAKENVDYAVVETGLGGRYDTSNVINRSDKLAVITNIGLDHTDVLGKTVREIAYQKAGILPRDGHAIAATQHDSDATRVIKQVADERNDSLEFVASSTCVGNTYLSREGLHFGYDDGDLKIDDVLLPTLGIYQIENAVVAIQTLKFLAKRDSFTLDEEKIRDGLKSTVIPGRSEVRAEKDRTILLDGAHNPQKIQALISSLERLELEEKPIWVLGVKKDKDSKAIADLLVSHTDMVICTEFFRQMTNPTLRDFALSSEKLKQYFSRLLPSKTPSVS